jgi:hypothetical protein
MMTWKEILSFEQFTDATVYFFMAAMGTVLFSIRLVMMMAFGLDDAGGDFDMDADVDAGGAMDIHDSGFGLFSMISILAFMMGAGWVGVACRTTLDLGPISTAMASSGFGFSLMFGSAFGMYQMKKFNAQGKYDVKNCIGNLGQVYLRIPERGKGHGEVQISVDGRSMMVKAVSSGDEIESFVTVKVLEIQQGSDTLIVEKHL